MLPAPDLLLPRADVGTAGHRVNTRSPQEPSDQRQPQACIPPALPVKPAPSPIPRPPPGKAPPLPTFRIGPWVPRVLLLPAWSWAEAALGPKAAAGQQPSQQHGLHGADEEQQQQDDEVVNWGGGRSVGQGPA